LEPRHIGCLGDEHRLHPKRLSSIVLPRADPPELQLQFVVLALSSALDEDRCRAGGRTRSRQESLGSLQPETEGDLVRIAGESVLVEQSLLMDGRSDYGNWKLSDQVGQLREERILLHLIAKDGEGAEILPDFALVEHDLIVTEMTELELGQGREKAPCVVDLANQAESQDEDRITVVDGRQAMIPALINEYEEVAVHSTSCA
jgi:hypothetical protein